MQKENKIEKIYDIKLKLDKNYYFYKRIKYLGDTSIYCENPRIIKTTNEKPTIISGDSIFKTYINANKSLKEKIENALFDLLYLKDLTKSKFKIEKMSGENDFHHLYLDYDNRIYFYFKDNKITLIDIIGHTKDKK